MGKKKINPAVVPVPAEVPKMPPFVALAEATDNWVTVDGLPMRIWRARTEKGTAFDMCVRCCRLLDSVDPSEFTARFGPPVLTAPQTPEGVNLLGLPRAAPPGDDTHQDHAREGGE